MMFKHGIKHILLNRFPAKPAWDLLALATIFVRAKSGTSTYLSFQQRMRCLYFYFHADGIRRLFAISSRSGARWTQLAIELALDLSQGGDGEYVYEDDIFYPRDGMSYQRLDWRAPTGEWKAQHARSSGPAFRKQKFFISHNPFFRVRTNQVRNMKTVVVTRSIPAILASLYFKFGNAPHLPDITLDDEDSFDWDASLTKSIEFFNSWGDVMRWHPTIRHYKYEAMKADPVGTHMDILNFWDMSVPEDCIAEGLRRASKKEMLNRMPENIRGRNNRVSVLDSKERAIISDARMRTIIDRLNRELIHDFGYTYDYDTPYNTSYD